MGVWLERAAGLVTMPVRVLTRASSLANREDLALSARTCPLRRSMRVSSWYTPESAVRVEG